MARNMYTIHSVTYIYICQEVYFSAANTLVKKLQSIDSKAVKLLLQWEHINARFDTDYTDLKKSEPTSVSSYRCKRMSK